MALGGLAGLLISFRAAATHQVYTEAVVAPLGPSPLSPLLSPDDAVAQTVGALTGRGLMAASPGGQPGLGMATSWRAEDGGSRYRFTLSSRRRWSDGTPITTKDVAFTLAVLQSPHFPNPDLAAPWAGVSLYASGLWAGTFVLPGPSADFATAAEVGLLPASHYHSDPERFFRGGGRTTALFPPSDGPFRVVANAPTQVSLVRNGRYLPHPILAGFTVQLEPNTQMVDAALAKGSVDGWLVATPGGLKALPKGVVRSRITTYSFVELLMNEGAAPLQSLVVRQAISAAVDRGQLLHRQLAGLGDPQYGPLPDSISLSASAGGSHAEGGSVAAILKAGGWVRPPKSRVFQQGGQPLSLSLDVPDLQPLPTAAKGIATQLDRQGFRVSVHTLPDSSFVSGTLADERFQVALIGFDNGPDPDLTSLWGSGVEAGQSLNFSQSEPDVYLDQALDQLATATTSASRQSAYREVARRLRIDLPAVFLYTPVDVYVHLSAVHVPGAATRGDPSERFRDVADWSL